MSEPAHHNDCVLVGTIDGFYRAPGGRIAGVLLRVDVGEPAVIAVVAPEAPLALPSGTPSAS